MFEQEQNRNDLRFENQDILWKKNQWISGF